MQWSEISAPCCGRQCVLLLCERVCLSLGKTNQHNRLNIIPQSFSPPCSFLYMSSTSMNDKTGFPVSMLPTTVTLLDVLSRTESESS